MLDFSLDNPAYQYQSPFPGALMGPTIGNVVDTGLLQSAFGGVSPFNMPQMGINGFSSPNFQMQPGASLMGGSSLAQTQSIVMMILTLSQQMMQLIKYSPLNQPFSLSSQATSMQGLQLGAMPKSNAPAVRQTSQVSRTTQQTSATAPVGQSAGKWALTFQDEFSGTSVNTSKWKNKGPTLAGNKELQKYTPDNLSQKNGVLDITPEKQTAGGQTKYTSGTLRTDGMFSQKYGYFEIRAQMPEGQGMWPAFWLRPNYDSPTRGAKEIDVFEYIGGKDPNTIHMTNHWGQNYGADHHQKPQKTTLNTATSQYHTYGIDWQPDSITWYIDGKPVAKSTEGVPQEEMFMILNLAIGGKWPGNPDATTPFGEDNAFKVDYVRVYQRK